VIDGRHDREHAALETLPRAGPVFDLAGSKPFEAALDRRQRVGGREQRVDIGFGQVERQGAESTSATSG
jgi:hypothetical protein